MHWPRFLRWSLASFAILAAGIQAFILVMDPYQDVPFAPPMRRALIAQNQRYSYPAVARSAAFDSAIIGTSTLRLLDPARLDAALGTRFANLAMNSATAYEQRRLHALFMRHHPAARQLVLGIDDSWCKQQPERYTFRGFPAWMYDDNRWNDLLYLFNDKALENAVRMWQYARGRRPEKYAASGFKDFTRDFGPLDLRRTRRAIYGAAQADPPPAFAASDVEPRLAHPEWPLPNLIHLPAILAATPAATRIVLVFPPFHAYHTAQEAARLGECKGRVLRTAAGDPRIDVLDYMLDGPLTREDANYWDPLHPIAPVAAGMAEDLAALLGAGTPPAPAHARLRLLRGAAAGAE